MQTEYPPCETADTETDPRTADNGYQTMDDWQIIGRADMTTEQIAAWYEAWYATTTEAEDEFTRRYATHALHAFHHAMGRKCARCDKRQH